MTMTQPPTGTPAPAGPEDPLLDTRAALVLLLAVLAAFAGGYLEHRTGHGLEAVVTAAAGAFTAALPLAKANIR